MFSTFGHLALSCLPGSNWQEAVLQLGLRMLGYKFIYPVACCCCCIMVAAGCLHLLPMGCSLVLVYPALICLWVLIAVLLKRVACHLRELLV